MKIDDFVQLCLILFDVFGCFCDYLKILNNFKQFYFIVQAFEVGVSFVMAGAHAIQMCLRYSLQARHHAVETAEVVTSGFDVPSVVFQAFPACGLCLIIATLGFARVVMASHSHSHCGRLEHN